MKSAYMICALLSVTISTLLLAVNGAAQPPKLDSLSSPTELSKNTTTTAIPTKNESETSEPPTTTTNTNGTTTTKPPSPTSPDTTTAKTTMPTTISTTVTPSTTTVTSTTTPTPAPTTPTPKTTPTSIPTSTAAVKTTAVPPAPSKDRQFDGLSFFGGIILTTCLMAIAAFSWKFFRQCKEGNYRTL